MTELFNVVFSGELSGRADPAVVRANIGKMFNASEAVLDKLFSGQPVAVKKMVDRATAMKLRAMMKQAGANTSMVQVDAQGRPVGDAAGSATVAAAARPAAPSMAERVAQLAEQQAKEEAARPRPDAPPPPADLADIQTWALYPTGALLGQPSEPAPDKIVKAPDLGISAVGSDLIQDSEKTVPPPVIVDVSGMSMAAAGSDVLKSEERPVVVPVVVDVSSISVAPVGAALDEIREHKPPVNPDISHLQLAAE